MTFLAVYHHDNLLNPIKLLTHREDIVVVLEEVAIAYDSIDVSAELHGDQEDAQLADNVRVRFDQVPHLTVLRLPAIPAYANAAQHQGPEQRCADASLRLFVRGGGVFCLHIGDHLYALGCVAGDLVSVPANVAHWFRQGTGSDCVIIHLASTLAGVQCTPCNGGLADRVELPEI